MTRPYYQQSLSIAHHQLAASRYKDNTQLLVLRSGNFWSFGRFVHIQKRKNGRRKLRFVMPLILRVLAANECDTGKKGPFAIGSERRGGPLSQFVSDGV